MRWLYIPLACSSVRGSPNFRRCSPWLRRLLCPPSRPAKAWGTAGGSGAPGRPPGPSSGLPHCPDRPETRSWLSLWTCAGSRRRTRRSFRCSSLARSPYCP
uniref:Putative secreted protein n=1 Tax=Ixodes ricinus TaxID=34613 RepID=A0A6B0UEX6_IXORI